LGCDNAPSSERLSLDVIDGFGVYVSTTCADTCREALDVELSYPDDLFRPEDEIVLLQYRVDYALEDDIKLPYFAAPIELRLQPDDVQHVTLSAAGSRQRAALLEAVGDDAVVRGDATLRIVGYDWTDRRVSIRQTFAIAFGPERPAVDGEGDGGTP
jgi:hypothetical protein